MKKRNFIAGFSAAFVATIALVSCGGIRAKDNVVLTINGHEYTAKELYEGQKTPAAAEAKFNAVYKVAIRRYFEEGQEGHGEMEEITRDTKLKVSGAKEEAKSNASKNGTKYDTEWKKILSTNGVEDEEGLYNKFEYDLMKTKFEDKFYEKSFQDQGGKNYQTNYDVLRNGGLFRDKTGKEYGTTGIKGYLNEKMPYHIKHILVKIGAKENDELYGEITAEQANKLYNIARSFVEGKLSFEQISDLYGSDDKTAQDNHGSLGIMSRDTSFVNDFKLGIYLYEAAYGSSTKTVGGTYDSKEAMKELFGAPSETGEKYKEGTAGWYANEIITNAKLSDPTNTAAGGIGQIPYEAFEMLKNQGDDGLVSSIKGVGNMDFSDTATAKRFTDASVPTDEVKAKYLPRNVIFNKYFNKHKIMVITPTKNSATLNTKNPNLLVEDTKVIRTTNPDSFALNAITEKYKRKEEGVEKEDFIYDLPGFKISAKNNDNVNINSDTIANKVLRDNNGRTVLVFRSGNGAASTSNADTYQGIHFVVIERSPFIGKEIETGHDGDPTTLNQYYTQYYPDQVGGNHPKYNDGKTPRLTYANYVKNDKLENQKKRSDTVKTELKKADDNLNTYLFDYLYSKGNITFSTSDQGKELKESITNWVDITKRENQLYEKNLNWNKTWKSYYYSLKSRTEIRNHNDSGTGKPTESAKISRLIPEACYYAFINKDFTIGDGGTGATLQQLFGKGGAFNG